MTVTLSLILYIFSANMQGVYMTDDHLIQMAKSYGSKKKFVFSKIMLPSVLSYVLPAFLISFGQSWKIAVMAEVLGLQNGIGASLASARNFLQTDEMFAWILILIISVLILEFFLIKTLDRYISSKRLR